MKVAVMITVFSMFVSFLSAQKVVMVKEGNKILKQFSIKVSQGVAVDVNFFYAINNTTHIPHLAGRVLITISG